MSLAIVAISILALFVLESRSDRRMQLEHEARLARIDAWVGWAKGGRA